jgi:hypothetical protein
MKVIDIVENANDIDWLNDQIKDISQFIEHFNNLVEINGYDAILYKLKEFINNSKSADWFYDMLSQTDVTVNAKYTHLKNLRFKLEQLINTGLSYE